MGKLIPFPIERRLTPENKAHLIQKITDIAIQISLLEGEKEELERSLNRFE